MREFSRISGLALLGGSVGLASGSATAATGSIAIVSGGFKWFINTNITFQTTSSNWGFSEASGAAPVQTDGGGTATLNDAFDGAMGWHVQHPGEADHSVGGYNALGGAVVAPSSPQPGQAVTVTGQPQTLQGLTVTGQIYFPAGKAVARSTLILHNPTAVAITVQVANYNNLGSDSNTTIVKTSSGDAVFDPGVDNWVVSYQNTGGVAISDPIITLAGMQQAVAAGYANGDDNPYQVFNVTVPPGGTKRVMTLVQLSATRQAAIASAPTFNDMASMRNAGYLADMGPAELQSIANWTYMAAASDVQSVPGLGGAALVALGGLVVVAAGSRRRKNLQVDSQS
jgi:hypothetical protein